MNKALKIILLVVGTFLYTAISWKLLSPPLTPAYPLVWIWAATVFAVLGIGLRLVANRYFSNYFGSYLCLGIAAGIMVLCGVVKVISLPMFNKDAYTYMYSIVDKEISEYDIGEEDFTWMPEQAAHTLAEENLKDKLTIVDSFELSRGVLQIINGRPAYVFSINAKNGEDDSPGFMVVDMQAKKAKYIETGSPMRFTPNKKGAQNIENLIRKEYISALVGESHLEINEDGAPFWVTYGNGSAASIMGKLKTKYIFTTDPFTGVVLRYKLTDAPSWIEQKQPVEEIISFYNMMTEQNTLPYHMEETYTLIPRGDQVVALVNIVLNDSQNAGAAIINAASGDILQTPCITAGTPLVVSRKQAWENTSKLHGWDVPFLYVEDEVPCFVTPMYDNEWNFTHYLFIDGMKADYYNTGVTWEKGIADWKEKCTAVPEPELEQSPEDDPITAPATSDDNPKTENQPESPTAQEPQNPLSGAEGVDYMLMSGLVESYTEGGNTFSVKLMAWASTTFYFSADLITAERLEEAKTEGLTFQYLPKYEGQAEVPECIPVDIMIATGE